MNRRRFLQVLAGTAAASTTAYFMPPISGWHPISHEIEYLRLRPGSLHSARWWYETSRDGVTGKSSQATIYMTPEHYAISHPWTPEIYARSCHRPGTEFRMAPGEVERWRKEAKSLSHLTPVQLYHEADRLWKNSIVD